MKILVDADACPVKEIIERVAKKHEIPVVMFIDSSHVLYSDYSEIVTVGQGKDAVDIALINRAERGDVVVTQDYGVAAMVLSKGGYCIHQSGKIFTDDNIGGLLMDRHLAKKARMSKSKNHMKGPKKRTQADNERFEASFESLIKRILNK